jgi:hypothetical protein
MSLFLENIWIWLGLAVLTALFGLVLYKNKPNGTTCVLAVAVPLLVFALGLALYYGVDTDNKSIRRMLDGLAAAIVEGNTDNVIENYVSPDAAETRVLAKTSMETVKITSAKYGDLKIESNPLATPPTAKIQFTGVFYWMPTKNGNKDLAGFALDKSVPEIIKFTVTLEKAKNNKWYVTNQCEFRRTTI